MRIVSSSGHTARTVSEQLGGIEWSTSYTDLLGDPEIEAIIIATPTPLHAEMIEAAATAGKHVFCEKPISLDLESTYRAIRAVGTAGVKLQVGFHRRFDPDYRIAREKIASGEVGDVYLFRNSFRDMQPPSFDFLRTSGGLFADLSLHDFDLARWLVGEVEEVTAVGAALSDPRFEELGDLDNAIIILQFAGGALGVIDNSRVAGYGYECLTEIMGSRATLRIGSHTRNAVEILTPQWSCRDYVSNYADRFNSAYLEEMEAFTQAVQADQEPEVSGADSAAAFAIAQAAGRSFREKRAVRLVRKRGSDEIVCWESD
jgi:myo-inositol 2-dehydrogenase/D-chiro-inositol 1-dehydrogenase